MGCVCGEATHCSGEGWPHTDVVVSEALELTLPGTEGWLSQTLTPLPLLYFRLMKGRWFGLGARPWCSLVQPASFLHGALRSALQDVNTDLVEGRLLKQVWGWETQWCLSCRFPVYLTQCGSSEGN